MTFDPICKSDFHDNYWNKDKKIIKTIWTTPLDMPEELYREEVNSQMNVTEEYSPIKMLVDTKEAYYNVKPETQDWINERFIGLVAKIQLEKMAWIVSEDFFAQVSFDQFMDDATEKQTLNLKHFTNEEDALNWLLE